MKKVYELILGWPTEIWDKKFVISNNFGFHLKYISFSKLTD